jgi:hypothetical protein
VQETREQQLTTKSSLALTDNQWQKAKRKEAGAKVLLKNWRLKVER